MSEFTHIVVGAGSAGCALAARLAEVLTNRVLLLEAGGADNGIMFRVPLGSGRLLYRKDIQWNYETEPEQATLNRRSRWIRGKVLGGTSSLNGMVYMRGHEDDYDAWKRAGNKGWSYADVLPYFKRSENHRHRNGRYHGKGGPLQVTKVQDPHPVNLALLEAAVQAGYQINDDFNGASQEGFGHYDFTLADGRRSSSASAFLHGLGRRPNLEVRINAWVQRVLMVDNRAVGVEYRQDGQLQTVTCSAEVVLSAGVFNSPLILMHSAIGDPTHLAEFGIEPKVALPGVGQNMQDHTGIYLHFSCPEPVTVHSFLRFDRAALAMARAIVLRTGPAANFWAAAAGGYVRSSPDLALPDILFHCSMGFGPNRLWVPHIYPRKFEPLERDGIRLGAFLCRPESRGKILLRSADPMDKPCIYPGELSDERDLDALERAIGIIRKVAAQPGFSRYIDGELRPGKAVNTSEALRQFIRSVVQPGNHQVGTCSMGNSTAAVVDDQLRVRGTTGLRIGDASVAPLQVTGNTNATAIMIGEKCADLILGRKLPAESAIENTAA